jgi:hypothetical protein
MRNNRLFGLIVVIGAMALTIALTFNAWAAAPQIASSDQAPSPASSVKARIPRAAATQIEPVDGALLLNRHDPRFSVASDAMTALDVEQTRISWGMSASVAFNKSQNSTGRTLDQQTRDAIQARWLAQHGGTNRTCVLLCGGQ